MTAPLTDERLAEIEEILDGGSMYGRARLHLAADNLLAEIRRLRAQGAMERDAVLDELRHVKEQRARLRATTMPTVICQRAWGEEDDWWVVVYENAGRLAGASVEGTGAEMRALAQGIIEGDGYHAVRCAVRRARNGNWQVWSPRNHASDRLPEISPAQAQGLAGQILRDVPDAMEGP